MKARDVMVSPVITVKAATPVREIAGTLLARRISAVPVVDDQGKLLGIVSEGDLMRRVEAGTERKHPWWLVGFTSDETLATEFIKARGRTAADVMTRNVITAAPDVPLQEIANLLEKNGIKRVPIVTDGRLVGIISRANILQAVATSLEPLELPAADSSIREKIVEQLGEQPWAHLAPLNVTVADGTVSLWGFVNSHAEKKAIRIAAESVPGVRGVVNNLIVQPIASAA